MVHLPIDCRVLFWLPSPHRPFVVNHLRGTMAMPFAAIGLSAVVEARSPGRSISLLP